jgi:hypothetical protein
METTILDLLKTVGLPVLLVLYYLFIDRPKQLAASDKEITRYDTLVAGIIASNKECADKMNNIMTQHTEAINNLKTAIENLKKH